MAELDFEIKGNPGEIAAFAFERALAHAIALLREFDSVISGQTGGSLRWYIGRLHSNGNLLVRFQSRLRPVKGRRDPILDMSQAVTGSFLTGFDDLENKCETPRYLSEFGLRRAGELTGLIGEHGPTALRFTSSNRTIEVTKKASENIGKLLPITRKSIGSVEGKLEAINIHAKPRVLVYQTISRKAVACEFDQDKFIDQVKEYLGRKVIVFGRLHKNIKGDTLRVTMERLTLPDQLQIVEREDWGEPEFASAPSTADYIRRIRGGGQI